MYYNSLLSLIILSIMTFFLLVPSLYHALNFNHLFYALFLILGLVGLLIGHLHEYQIAIAQRKEQLKKLGIHRSDLAVVFWTTLATVLTFHVNNELGLGGVVASALVGLSGPLLLPGQQRSIFCGSFAGMASITVFEGTGWVIISGLFAGLLLAASREIYDGFGGKLGACGFFGTMSAALLSRNFTLFSGTGSPTADLNIAIFFIIGAVMTYYINKINNTGTVLASSAVGLATGLILPVVYGGPGVNYSVAAFCGSFLGMTVIDRLTSEFYLFLTSYMGSIIYFFSQQSFIGLGGKLGTTAFSSIVAWWGLMQIYDLLRQKRFRWNFLRKDQGDPQKS